MYSTQFIVYFTETASKPPQEERTKIDAGFSRSCIATTFVATLVTSVHHRDVSGFDILRLNEF